jgi:hypothetical protein
MAPPQPFTSVGRVGQVTTASRKLSLSLKIYLVRNEEAGGSNPLPRNWYRRPASRTWVSGSRPLNSYKNEAFWKARLADAALVGQLE